MSSTDDLQPSPPEVSGATQAADVPDSLLNQLMDQHEAEVHLQNLHLHSGGGSQETGTEAAIPYQQESGSPTTPSNLTETMDDSDVTYAPTDDDEEEEDSNDSVEFIAETQVQEEEIQSTQLAPPQSSQMLESHQESAAAAVRDSTEDLGDSELDAEIERLEQEAARLRQLRAARRTRPEHGPEPRRVRPRVTPKRQRQEQGPEQRNVRPQMSPEHDRQAPRERSARPRERQGSIDNFVRNVGNVRRAHPSQRRLSAHPEPSEIPLPQNEQELYDQWIATANDIIPEDASIYSDFRLAFGDETDEGRRFQENEIKAIARILFDFKQNRRPGQHAMLKGREREGKTGALFSIALAAIILRMRVVILCAPNKVAPVVDMVKKIRAAGFGKYWNVRHTLGKKAIQDNDIPSSDVGQIFVAALGTLADLKKVKQFIQGEARGGHCTVTLIDECDELTQGRGNRTLNVPHREDPANYQHYITSDARGEDEEDDDIPEVDPDSRRAMRGSRKENIAAASHFFKTELFERTQVFACSATLSGYMLNPVGVFQHHLETPIFMVYPKPGYRGIEKFFIPEGCALETEGNLSLNQFKDSEPVQRMLRRFYDRENVCDGVRLEPSDRCRGGAVKLRGMLFISCSPKVNVYGGVADIAREVCNTVDSWADVQGLGKHDSKETMFVCFVGKPTVRFGNKWLKMPSGASLETIYNRTAQEARKGSFSGLQLGLNEPFSSVCKHVVLIGYNLTRRAMTAAFTPADEPGVLCKLQYGILTAPKTLTIDAVSQRFNRCSHDFGDYEVPENYCVDVAMYPVALDMCKEFRKLEDEMVDEQRRNPRIHAEFRQQIQVFAKNLEDTRVSKRNIRLAELSRTGRLRKEMMEREATADRDPLLIDFKRWLKEYEHRPGELFSENTVTSYYRIVRRLFFDEDDIEVIEGRAVCIWRVLRAMEERNSSLTDQYNAIRRFVEFRGIGDEANDDHNEEDQRIFEDWLAEDQHQREAQQNTHPRQQPIEASAFLERLHQNRMVEKQIEADGNCQFRALADQLFDGDQDRYAECRAAAINQLRSEPTRYMGFITEDEDWETYVQRMEQDRECGDHITLQAAADSYKVTVHLYSANPDELEFPRVFPHMYIVEGRTIHHSRIIRLSHHPEVHYNSVHPSFNSPQQQARP